MGWRTTSSSSWALEGRDESESSSSSSLEPESAAENPTTVLEPAWTTGPTLSSTSATHPAEEMSSAARGLASSEAWASSSSSSSIRTAETEDRLILTALNLVLPCFLAKNEDSLDEESDIVVGGEDTRERRVEGRVEKNKSRFLLLDVRKRKGWKGGYVCKGGKEKVRAFFSTMQCKGYSSKGYEG